MMVSKAIDEKRCVVARFRLSAEQWKNLIEFFKRKPTGVITKEALDAPVKWPRGKKSHKAGSHAVVIVNESNEDNYYIIKNSYGQGFAD